MALQSGPNQGTIGPTRIGLLALAFVVGAVVGYAFEPLVVLANGTAPRISVASVLLLVAIAAVLLALAYSTYRTIHRNKGRLEPYRAVNFLVLAKACALMGALVAGGYVGFGSHFLGEMDIALPRERVFRSAAAAVASVVIVISALLLERACRVPRTPDD